MRRSIEAVAPCLYGLILLALAALPASAFELGDRWNRTATNGTAVGSQGSPITLTWSFAPDGTTIPAENNTTTSSKLISFLDKIYGAGPGGTDYTLRPWFGWYQQSFDRMSALSGVTYVYEPNDDGANFTSSTSGRGTLGVRGDVRIGGRSYVSTSTLASNYYPSYGEMMFNTDRESWYSVTTNNNRRLRNVIMHEAMHGLGIRHVESSSSAFLIEPTLSTSFDGPQLDDLLAMQRHYGDFYEKNGGNDTFNLATPLGTVTATQSRQLGTLGSSTVISSTQTDFLSIDDDSDTDFFSFSINSRLDVRLLLTPRGTTYQVGPQDGTQISFNTLTLSDLSLALFDTSGTSMLASANANPAGGIEEITRQLLPGTYYARVRGAANNIQLYGIMASATTPLPVNLVWAGNVNNVWNTGITANFTNAGASSLFWDLDHVTFDDTSAVKTVSLADNISAGQIQINTNSGYAFTGSGGITAGTMTINGSGTVELANAGNSYAGNTVVNSGTLAITGNANAMKSLMIVNSGATLLMNPTEAGLMTSNFTIASGGLLQIGTPSSSGNIFPDNPTSVVNNGTIRVYDEEVLRSVSGTGTIEIEQETTTLQANGSFTGTVTVRSGAVARIIDNGGLGSASATATIESGGTLLVDASPTIAAKLKVTDNGIGSGAVRVTAANNAIFSGVMTLQGEQATIQADAGATATFLSQANGSVDQTDVIMQSELGANLRFQGGLSLGGGGVTKRGAGTGELLNVVNYGGETIVEEGTLRMLGLGTITGAMHVSSGASLEIAASHTLASSVRISGAGQVQGSVVMPGTIAPGDTTGTLTFMNSLFFTSESRLELELGGTQAGIGSDFVQIVDMAVLDGELRVSLIDDFVPELGNLFEILNAFGGVSGTFDEVILPALDNGLEWNVTYGASSLFLAVQEAAAITIPGDYNGDGVVNASDYVVWRDTLGSMELLDADGDGNDVVDAGDYPVWSANFGMSQGVGSAEFAQSASGAVPEPTSLALLLSIALGVLGLRSRIH